MVFISLQGLKYNKYNKSFKRIRLEKFNGFISEILSHFGSSAEWKKNEKTEEKSINCQGGVMLYIIIFINHCISVT